MRRGFQLSLQRPSIFIIPSVVCSKRHQWLPKFPFLFTMRVGSSEPAALCGSVRKQTPPSKTPHTDTENPAGTPIFPLEVWRQPEMQQLKALAASAEEPQLLPAIL